MDFSRRRSRLSRTSHRRPGRASSAWRISRMLDWTEVVPLSAKTGLYVDRLLELTVKLLSEGEALYEEDVMTDQPMRTLAAEIIREKILQKAREEVPYSVAVEIDRFVEEGKL